MSHKFATVKLTLTLPLRNFSEFEDLTKDYGIDISLVELVPPEEEQEGKPATLVKNGVANRGDKKRTRTAVSEDLCKYIFAELKRMPEIRLAQLARSVTKAGFSHSLTTVTRVTECYHQTKPVSGADLYSKYRTQYTKTMNEARSNG